ncbi:MULTISPECIES: hypothetical protein [unclassified Leptolyngbya]|nr:MULTISPECIES: hypothetical protein [unclassified Leptolyngbya]
MDVARLGSKQPCYEDGKVALVTGAIAVKRQAKRQGVVNRRT